MASRDPSIPDPPPLTPPTASAVPVADSSEVQAEVKGIMTDVYEKLKIEFQSSRDRANTFLMEKIKDLESSKTQLVGVFGKTGAGKSSLINAIIGTNLLPSGDLSACTEVMIQVQANMKDSNYIAEIEFIPVKEWKDEVWYLTNKEKEEGDKDDDSDDDDSDNDDDDDVDDDEKFEALYGEDFKNSAKVDYMANKHFKDIPEFLISKKKTLTYRTSSELSKELARYTRHYKDSKEGGQYWPLVKCVTVKVPDAIELLQHVALVDLPGTGDCNKSRDEMWKKFVQNCGAVWIVNERRRALSAKEPWDILEETISLIGNGGECQSISFICTNSDHLGQPEEGLSKRESVLQKNEEVKKLLQTKLKKFEEKSAIKKHFGEESHKFFQLFTVSSVSPDYLKGEDTEIPKLKRSLEYLSDRHSKTNYYVNGAYGILSLMEGAKTQGADSVKAAVCKKLQRRLKEWIDIVGQSMTKSHEAFENCLDEGVSKSEEVFSKKLEPATGKKKKKHLWPGKIHFRKLKCLVQNNGNYKPKRKKGSKQINLNERLSKYMREKIDDEFCKTFPNAGRSGPIKEAINKFSMCSLSAKHQEVALQMKFMETEEEKLKTKLVDVIRVEKKEIYSSLEESIQKSMQPCYHRAAGISGAGMLAKMKEEMYNHLNASKSTMFVNAKKDMLKRMDGLKNALLKTLQEDMQTSIDQSLKTDFKSVPDVTEQYEKVKNCYEELKRRGLKRSRPHTGEEFTSPRTKQRLSA